MAVNSVGSTMSASVEDVAVVYLTDAISKKTYQVKVSSELAEKLQTDMRLAQIILENCIKESNAADEQVKARTSAETDTVVANGNCLNRSMHSVNDAPIPGADDTGDIVLSEQDDKIAADIIPPEQDVDVSDDEEDGDSGKFNWSSESTLMFITEYERMEEKFSSGKHSKKACFELLSKNLNSQGVKVCGKKCCTKLLSLTRQYKAIVDHNSKSGNDKMKDWPYFERMDQIFRKKPWVKPLSTASSSQVRDSPTSGGENGSRDGNTRKPNGKRAQKNNFLQDFVDCKRKSQEHKERYYEAKLERMDKMNQLLAQLADKENIQEDDDDLLT